MKMKSVNITSSSNSVRIGACQLPDIRKDIDNCSRWIEDHANMAQQDGIALLCFPECFLQGYLTDLESASRHALDLGSTAFQALLNRLAIFDPTLVIGLIESDRGKLYNTAAVISHGELLGRYRKCHLLASESIFTAGDAYPIFETNGLKFGINICYDTNFPVASASFAGQGAGVVLCPANNMLPHPIAEKWKHRHHDIRRQRAMENGLWLISADVTGTRDHCISYGPTSAINPKGEIVSQVPLGKTGIIAVDVPLS